MTVFNFFKQALLLFFSTPEIKIETLLMCEVLKWSVEVKPICIKAINGLLVKMS